MVDFFRAAEIGVKGKKNVPYVVPTFREELREMKGFLGCLTGYC
jgi:hypothetical protein